MKLKDTPWKRSYDQPRQHIKKQRHYFANKGPSSQGYGFSCGHVWNDAAFIHPTMGAHPAVLIWPDAFGLRPVMREIGKRIAGEGYSVLVPNPFYRVAKAPVF